MPPYTRLLRHRGQSVQNSSNMQEGQPSINNIACVLQCLLLDLILVLTLSCPCNVLLAALLLVCIKEVFMIHEIMTLINVCIEPFFPVLSGAVTIL